MPYLSSENWLEYFSNSFAAYKEMPVVVGVGTVAAGVGAVEPTLPAGSQAGDIAVWVGETNGTGTLTVSGFTTAGNSPQKPASGATKLWVFWRRLETASDATISNDSGDHCIARIIVVRGCVATGDPFDVTAGGTDDTADTSGAIPGATTTVYNCLVLAAGCHGSDTAVTFGSWTNANLTDVTERMDDSTSEGDGGGIGLATGGKVAAGDYGTTAVTYSASVRKGLWSGALKPA